MKKVLSRTEVADYFGVNPQTVTNWADAGLIKRLNKATYSGASVERLAKEFADLPDITQQIKDARAELQTLRDEVSAIRADILLRHESRRLSAVFAEAYRVVSSKSLASKARSVDIVCSLLTKEKSIGQLAEKYGVTVNRIAQLAEKSVRYFAASVPVYKQLCQQVEEDKVVIEEQNMLISALQKRIDQHDAFLKSIGVNGQDVGAVSEEHSRVYKMLNCKLNDFNLSVRTLNITSFNGINTIGDLIRHHRRDLLKLRNLGFKSMSELDDLLDKLGLQWNTDVDNIVRRIHAAALLK